MLTDDMGAVDLLRSTAGEAMTDKKRIRCLRLHAQTLKEQLRNDRGGGANASPLLTPGEMLGAAVGTTLLGPFGLAMAANKHAERVRSAQPSKKHLARTSRRIDTKVIVDWLLRDLHDVTDFEHATVLEKMGSRLREAAFWTVAVFYAVVLVVGIGIIMYLLLMQ